VSLWGCGTSGPLAMFVSSSPPLDCLAIAEYGGVCSYIRDYGLMKGARLRSRDESNGRAFQNTIHRQEKYVSFECLQLRSDSSSLCPLS
jgi:hypothetical protein